VNSPNSINGTSMGRTREDADGGEADSFQKNELQGKDAIEIFNNSKYARFHFLPKIFPTYHYGTKDTN
jgi:hypothetical protein